MRELFELEEVCLVSSKKAYIPDNWEEAEALAKENGLTIVDLSKKDGQNGWYNNGGIMNPFTFEDIPFPDDYFVYENIDEVEELILNNIKEANSIELVRRILEEFEIIEEEFDDLEDGEAIVLYNYGEEGYHYYKTLYDVSMGYSYDTTTHCIGLVEK